MCVSTRVCVSMCVCCVCVYVYSYFKRHSRARVVVLFQYEWRSRGHRVQSRELRVWKAFIQSWCAHFAERYIIYTYVVHLSFTYITTAPSHPPTYSHTLSLLSSLCFTCTFLNCFSNLVFSDVFSCISLSRFRLMFLLDCRISVKKPLRLLSRACKQPPVWGVLFGVFWRLYPVKQNCL